MELEMAYESAREPDEAFAPVASASSQTDYNYAPEFEPDDMPAYVPSRPAPKSNQSRGQAAASRKKNGGKKLLITLCSIAAVLLLMIIGMVIYLLIPAPDDGLILSNVTVAGIDLGGMTPGDAKDALHRATDLTYTQEDMVVQIADTTLHLSPADTGVSLDVDAIVEAAYSYGRNGTKAENKQAKENAATSVHDIDVLPYLNLDTEYIQRVMEEQDPKFNSEFTESSFELVGEAPELNGEFFDETAPCQTLMLHMGTPGRSLDMEAVYGQILKAYRTNTFEITVEVEQEDRLPTPLDLDAIYELYCSEPVDAAMDMETFEVGYEIYGYSFDMEAAQKLLDEAAYGDIVEIPMQYTAPAVLKEAVDGVLFRDVLGSYETKHTADTNRNTNLELACKAINGTVLNPGDVFDYNTVVGKRTAEAGYKSADAYSGGKTVKTLGGGICQVSSTLYYCTLVADLEIVDRSPHSYVSSYMPMGMDATVSWGGPEFKFKNSTNYPIRIEAEVSGGYVKVKLLGTDEKDYYIKMEYEVVAYESPTTVYEEYAPDNAEGYKDGQTIQSSYKGYTVKTYKCKYDKENDELISRDFDRTSKYKKRDKIVVKIVKNPEPTTAPTDPVETPTEAPTTPAPTVPPATEPTPTTPPATTPPAADPGEASTET